MFEDINDDSVRAYDPQFLATDLESVPIAVIASVDKSYKTGDKEGKPFTSLTYEVLRGDFKGSRFTIKYDHTVEDLNKKTGETYPGGIPLIRRIAIACGHYEVKEDNEKHVKQDANGMFNPTMLMGKKFIGDVKAKKNKDYWNYRIFNEREFTTDSEPVHYEKDRVDEPSDFDEYQDQFGSELPSR